ncbi:hypothetical protein PtB15_5B672 [Puccinia triticina]|nr:hypothetical protein PtB15_5B672 [Puccinia triticina]
MDGAFKPLTWHPSSDYNESFPWHPRIMMQESFIAGDKRGWHGGAMGNITRVQPSTTPEGTPPRDLAKSSVTATSGSAGFIVQDTIAPGDTCRSQRAVSGNVAKHQITKEEVQESAQDTWTENKKMKLLVLILKEQTYGFPTKKTSENLPIEGWTNVADQMKKHFGTNFRLNSLKDQLNKIRKTYVDLNFLRKQSGFQWDEQKYMIIANDTSWEKLLKTRSKKKYSQLRQTPFEWYTLAEQVFWEEYEATKPLCVGESSHQAVLPDEGNNSMRITPSSEGTRVENELEQPEYSPRNDNADVGALAGAEPERARIQTQPPFLHAAEEASNPTLRAITLMAPMFLHQVSTVEYAKFVEVVETENNAKVFLCLLSTTNSDTCKAWLIRKSSKL